jgi:hypothetical protein
MVDAPADVFIKIAAAVIPPRVPSWFRVMQSVRIDESRARQPRERLPLALRNVCTAMTGAGIPHIDIVGRHVEIPADNPQSGAECYCVRGCPNHVSRSRKIEL